MIIDLAPATDLVWSFWLGDNIHLINFPTFISLLKPHIWGPTLWPWHNDVIFQPHPEFVTEYWILRMFLKPFPFRRCLFGQKCQVSAIIVFLPLLFQFMYHKGVKYSCQCGWRLGRRQTCSNVDLICWLKCFLRSCYCRCHLRHLGVCFHLSSLCTWFCVVWALPLQLITPQTHPTAAPVGNCVFVPAGQSERFVSCTVESCHYPSLATVAFTVLIGAKCWRGSF